MSRQSPAPGPRFTIDEADDGQRDRLHDRSTPPRRAAATSSSCPATTTSVAGRKDVGRGAGHRQPRARLQREQTEAYRPALPDAWTIETHQTKGHAKQRERDGPDDHPDRTHVPVDDSEERRQTPRRATSRIPRPSSQRSIPISAIVLAAVMRECAGSHGRAVVTSGTCAAGANAPDWATSMPMEGVMRQRIEWLVKS